jgi:hypothetical protein
MAQGFYAIRVKNPATRPADETGLAQRLSHHRMANSVDNLAAVVHRTTQARLSHHRKVVYRTTASSSIPPPKPPKTQYWRGLATP